MSPGCRFAYELDPSQSSVGLGGDTAAGTGANSAGDGDGDGDVSGDGGGVTGDGDLVGSGGAETGGAETGGAETGGAGTGGAGTGGAGSGGAGSGGAGTGGAGSGGAGTQHVGGSTSLAEAIDAANATGTPQTITFDPGLNLVFSTSLPTVTVPITFAGNDTSLDFTGSDNSGFCFEVDAVQTVFDGLEIIGCPGSPVIFAAGGGQVTNTTFRDSAGALTSSKSGSGMLVGPGNVFTGGTFYAVFVNNGADVVLDNTFIDGNPTGNAAIFVGSDGDGADLIGNLIVRGFNGIQFSANGDNVNIYHNSIVDVGNVGIVVGQAFGIDIRNNVITHAGLYGINANSANLTFLDYNLYFANGSHCNGCAAGLGANSRIQDPMYVNFAGDDFRPQMGSVLIDNAFDLVDRNGGGPGNFFGTAPDIGYFETNF